MRSTTFSLPDDARRDGAMKPRVSVLRAVEQLGLVQRDGGSHDGQVVTWLADCGMAAAMLRIGPAPPPTGSFRPAPSALNREAAEMPSADATSQVNTIDTPQEVVLRPHGLRHGRWEAPQWAFWTAMGLVLVLALAYGLVRLGYFRRKT